MAAQRRGTALIRGPPVTRQDPGQALPLTQRPAPPQAGPVVVERVSCGIGLMLLADDPLRPYRHRINLEQHPRQRERGHAAQCLGRQPFAKTGV